MDALTAVLTFGVLIGSLAMGVWVAISLLVTAAAVLYFFADVQAGQLLASSSWSAIASYPLTALPLFIWMGEILSRSRLSEDLFAGLAPWLRGIPGGLIHVNILGCGVFAAVSGSSAATCATIGRLTIPELRSRKYDEELTLGTLAGSGTLGLLIPPSIILIVYGVATEQSIARLFIAGVLPGLMLIAFFMAYVIAWAIWNRHRMPAAEPPIPFLKRIWATRRLIPVVSLIVGIVGTIYTGLASPTDAAAVGIALALLITHLSGALTWRQFIDGLFSALRTSCMICLIVAGAAFLTAAMGFLGLPQALAKWIGTLGLSPVGLLFALTVFFIILGCILDGVSIVILTTAVVLPMVQAAGFDLIWFGIYLVIAVEMSQITPPVGFNLFVIQGLTGYDILYITKAAFPFFLLMLAAVVMLFIFPEIATWLPQHMMAP